MRQTPTQLLGNLIPHGLLAFDSEGLLEGGYVEPSFLVFALAYESSAVADQAIDQGEMGAASFDLKPVSKWDIFRHEYVCLDPCRCCVRGQGATGVAC